MSLIQYRGRKIGVECLEMHWIQRFPLMGPLVCTTLIYCLKIYQEDTVFLVV